MEKSRQHKFDLHLRARFLGKKTLGNQIKRVRYFLAPGGQCLLTDYFFVAKFAVGLVILVIFGKPQQQKVFTLCKL